MGQFLTLHERVLPPFFPRVIVEAAVAAGAERTAVFEGTALPPSALDSPDARVSYGQLCTLIENAQRLTGDPALALLAGERTRLTSLGLLGAAVMSSATCGEALGLLMRHWPGLCPGLSIVPHLEGERLRIELKPTLDLPCLEFLIDMSLVSLATQAEFVLGRPPPVLEAHTANPAAPHRFRRFVEVIGIEVSFDAPRTEIVLDADVLKWPCVHAEPNTQVLAERMHVESMTSYEPPPADLAQQVEHVLGTAEDRNPSVTEVARELGVSARTLRRTLAASGTSFRTLRERALHTRAARLLETGTLTQTQISDRLGYADVRAFRRAFKRWTGKTPGAQRRSSGAHAHAQTDRNTDTEPA